MKQKKRTAYRGKKWKTAAEAFAVLNDCCTYLVMRNYEHFYEELLLEGHNDIDVLCRSPRDRRKMVKALGAVPRLSRDNGIHYRFRCGGKEMDLDIRCVGDGYYDRRWQKEMLKTRVYDKRGFYHMEEDDYFYSLLYHGVYQKEGLSEEYFQRLNAMNGPILWERGQEFAEDAGRKLWEDPAYQTGAQQKHHICFQCMSYAEKQRKERVILLWEEALLVFMRQRGYRYTKTRDSYITLHFPEEKVGAYIRYPWNIRIRHLAEKTGGYVTGKINGARARLLRRRRRIKRRKAGSVKRKQMRQMICIESRKAV